MIEILVVDDDPLMRELLAEWLSDAGYGVRQAENGTTALQMLRSRPAGLLITDMDMPGRDGAQTLDEARRMLQELIAARATRVVSAWGIATLQARLGDVDEAFRWLDAAVEEGATGLVFLRVHPRLDPIRQDPRFGALLRKVGLDLESR